MNTLTDQNLLHDYAQHGSDSAFAELARRHVDFVYSTALRIAREDASAQDITQNVFIALAKSARTLASRPVLTGWLHQTTRNIAANTIRAKIRRRNQEQEAATMNELLSSADQTSWDEVAPQLDEALGELSDSDRDAVLLRYFQGKTAQEMALTLGVSHEAAQKRVNRAIERLRESLSKRKVSIATAGLVVVISANAVQSAPAGFVANLAASAATIHSAAAIASGKAVVLATLTKALLAIALVAAAGAGIYELRHLTSDQSAIPITAAQTDSNSVAALPVQTSHPAIASIAAPLHDKPSHWTGRKNAHEPTLALAEEDLTNALAQLGPDADLTPDVWVQKGEIQARLGNWKDAVTNLQQALVIDPADSWAGYLLSSALLESGNLPEYQNHSHAMMVSFGGTRDQNVAGRTSEAYLVAPYGDNTDLETSVSLVERKKFYWWREFYEGLAQYRLGHFSAAVDLLENDISELASVNHIDRSPCEADCYLVLAMTRRQLNQPDEATAALAHGRAVAETQMPQNGDPDLGPYWWNGVTTRTLFKEARAIVEQWLPNPARALLTFSLAHNAAHPTNAQEVIPLTGPFSEPTSGPLHIVPESVVMSGGQMQFTVAGITPGATICIQASEELFTPSSWIPISTNIATNVTLTIGSIPTTNALHQFFRVLETR